MSHFEIERFQNDIRVRGDLIEKVKLCGSSLGAIAETARDEGYGFDLDDLKGYIVSKSSGALSDEQLAAVVAAGTSWVFTSTVVIATTVAAAATVGGVVGGVVAVTVAVY